MRGDRDRLLDILEAIDKIEKHVSGIDQARFMDDELLQVWCVHHIQIIGEAAAKVPVQLRDQYSDIPWQDIMAMRNVLVHQYFGIDIKEIWNTVNIDLPALKNQALVILEQLQ